MTLTISRINKEEPGISTAEKMEMSKDLKTSENP